MPVNQNGTTWYKTSGGITFLVILSILVIGAVLFFGMVGYYAWQIKYGDQKKLAESFAPNFTAASNLPSPTTKDAVTMDSIRKAINKDTPVVGNKNAPITVVAFIDFECPFSQKSYPIFKGVMETYGPVTQFVFKNFPLNDAHPNALNSAHAAACAGAQGKFWPYYNTLFTTKRLDEDSLLKYAVDLKLDTTKFATCYDNMQFADQIENDIKDGANFGVRGTPTYFVNGTQVEGAVTREIWDKVFEEELEKI